MLRASTPERDIKNIQKKFELLAVRDIYNKSPIEGRTQQWQTTRNSIELLGASRRQAQSMSKTSDAKQIRLNPQNLELLNNNELVTESSVDITNAKRIRQSTMMNMDLPLDDLAVNLCDNNLLRETVHGQPRSRGLSNPNIEANRRRSSSTFSTYYLNKQAKDLASLMTIEDRKKKDLFGGEDIFIDDQDFEDGRFTTLPVERKSKVGDKQTVATRAMFSFKSEL